MAGTTKRKLTPEVRRARAALKQKGYTYQDAAVALGRTVQHLALVLTCNGRSSKDLLRRIHALPKKS